MEKKSFDKILNTREVALEVSKRSIRYSFDLKRDLVTIRDQWNVFFSLKYKNKIVNLAV